MPTCATHLSPPSATRSLAGIQRVPSAKTMPSRKRAAISSVTAPSRCAMYCFSTCFLGESIRCAKSPSLVRISSGAHHARRLVEHEIDKALADGLSSHQHLCRVAELCFRFFANGAVNRDSAALYQLLHLTAAACAARGEIFVQSFHNHPNGSSLPPYSPSVK